MWVCVVLCACLCVWMDCVLLSQILIKNRWTSSFFYIIFLPKAFFLGFVSISMFWSFVFFNSAIVCRPALPYSKTCQQTAANVGAGDGCMAARPPRECDEANVLLPLRSGHPTFEPRPATCSEVFPFCPQTNVVSWSWQCCWPVFFSSQSIPYRLP